MIWGAYGAQQPSSGGHGWQPTSENDIRVICITAGHNASGPAPERRPQQDSNLRSRLRRRLAVGRVTWEYVSVSRSVVRVWTTVFVCCAATREPSSILSVSEGIIGFATWLT